jgi:hypothetical protein
MDAQPSSDGKRLRFTILVRLTGTHMDRSRPQASICLSQESTGPKESRTSRPNPSKGRRQRSRPGSCPEAARPLTSARDIIHAL